MIREDLQSPEGPAVQAQLSREEMGAACGRTLAFIMALDKTADGEDPDMGAAIAAAKHARVAAAIVLASLALAEAAKEAVRNAGKKGATLVQALEYDSDAAIPLTREAGGFELFGLPFGLLVTIHALAESLLDDYDAVLVIDAAQGTVSADGIYGLCLDAREHADAEVVVSHVRQQRCLPCLITRRFLNRLAERDPLLIGAGVTVEDAPIRICDHVFGE